MTAWHTERTRRGGRKPFELPDPPERRPGEMTNFNHLSATGNVHYLIQHFGKRGITLVAGELYLIRAPNVPRKEWRIPDLLIAFDADPELYKANNGYIIAEQEKPPDFAMKIASRDERHRDDSAKREDYLEMGIPEYWRFDETGNCFGARLAGDLLVDGQYQEIPIATLSEGVLQGYSPVLNLYIRWDHEELKWHDPATGQHIRTLETERAAREAERAAYETARAGRIAAEDRVRELEAELARRNLET